jgi:hypothetical protein
MKMPAEWCAKAVFRLYDHGRMGVVGMPGRGSDLALLPLYCQTVVRSDFEAERKRSASSEIFEDRRG